MWCNFYEYYDFKSEGYKYIGTNMIVSLNPSYHCNFRCPFCYLTPKQLAERAFASLDSINDRLTEILTYGETIDCIDIYGGEIATLDDDYVKRLLGMVVSYADRVNLVTNLSEIKDYMYSPNIELYVSYDHKARERWKEVYANMVKLGNKNFVKNEYTNGISKEFNILMLTSKGMLKNDVQEIIDHCNKLEGLKSVEIKPYSPNQANQQKVTHIEHEEFVKGFLTAKRKLKCTFHNEDLIVDSLNGTNNAFSDDHVYITPNAKFAVLEFDKNDNEFFLELDSYQDYLDWASKEKVDTYLNGYCAACPYLGSCLSEHLREVKDINKSCNGYKLLLDWYDENREWKRYTK